MVYYLLYVETFVRTFELDGWRTMEGSEYFRWDFVVFEREEYLSVKSTGEIGEAQGVD